MSNFFNKNIDGLTPELNVENLTAENLTLQNLQYTDGNQADGYVLTSDALGNATWQPESSAEIVPSNVIYVHPTYSNTGQFRSTVAGALTYANTLSPGPFNEIHIKIQPAFYVETSQLVVNNYVHLEGESEFSVTIALGVPLASGEAFVRIANEASLYYLTISANELADYCITAIGPLSQLVLRKLTLTGALVACAYADGFNILFLVMCILAKTTASTQYGGYANGGWIYGDICIAIDQTGSPLTAAFRYDNINFPTLAVANLNRVSIQGCATGIEANNSYVVFGNAEIRDATTGIDANTGSTVQTQNINFQNISGNEIDIDATSFYYSNACFHDISKFNVVDYDNISINYLETRLNNERGQHFIGNVIIGDQTTGSMTFMGQGSTNPEGTVILQYDGVSTFTDVTNDLSKDVQTTTDLFTNLTTAEFYVGRDDKFASVIFDVAQIIDFGTGLVAFEYWNGSSWSPLNVMAAKTESPYTTYGQNLFSLVQEEVVRFNIKILNGSGNWALTTVNGINKYWTRARITAAINQTPRVNYLQTYGNTTIVEEDGTLEHHGEARTKKQIFFDTNIIQSAGSPPLNQDIFLSQNIGIGKSTNEFANGDRAGSIFFLPPDLDSSCPVSLDIAFFSSDTAAAQAVFDVNIYITVVDEGDQIFQTSGAGPATHKNEQVLAFNITPNQTNGGFLVFDSLEFFLPQAIAANEDGQAKQLIALTIERGADANGNNFIVCQYSLYYFSFRTSGISIA